MLCDNSSSDNGLSHTLSIKDGNWKIDRHPKFLAPNPVPKLNSSVSYRNVHAHQAFCVPFLYSNTFLIRRPYHSPVLDTSRPRGFCKAFWWFFKQWTLSIARPRYGVNRLRRFHSTSIQRIRRTLIAMDFGQSAMAQKGSPLNSLSIPLTSFTPDFPVPRKFPRPRSRDTDRAEM